MYVLVEHILATRSGSDIGFYNKWGVRNRLYQGKITARHIWNIHPFGNQLAIVQILGKNIGGQLSERLTATGTGLIPIISIRWRRTPLSSSQLGASYCSGLPSRCSSKRF